MRITAPIKLEEQIKNALQSLIPSFFKEGVKVEKVEIAPVETNSTFDKQRYIYAIFAFPHSNQEIGTFTISVRAKKYKAKHGIRYLWYSCGEAKREQLLIKAITSVTSIKNLLD